MRPPNKITLPPSLTLGYPPLDDQHQTLIDQLNALDDAIEQDDTARINDALMAFQTSFVHHMDEEIRLLRDLGYQNADDHGRAHARIVSDLRAYIATVRSTAQVPDIKYLLWCFLEDAIREDMDVKGFLQTIDLTAIKPLIR